jgi:hypothetical protein
MRLTTPGILVDEARCSTRACPTIPPVSRSHHRGRLRCALASRLQTCAPASCARRTARGWTRWRGACVLHRPLSSCLPSWRRAVCLTAPTRSCRRRPRRREGGWEMWPHSLAAPACPSSPAVRALHLRCLAATPSCAVGPRSTTSSRSAAAGVTRLCRPSARCAPLCPGRWRSTAAVVCRSVGLPSLLPVSV